MKKLPRFFKNGHPLFLKVSVGVTGLLCFTVITILSYSYLHNTRALLLLSKQLISQANRAIISQTLDYLHPAARFSELGALLVKEGRFQIGKEKFFHDFSKQVFAAYPQITALYFGDRKGQFLMSTHKPDQTYATQIIYMSGQNKRQGKWIYRDRQDRKIKELRIHPLSYDPRTRPWYVGALQEKRKYWTDVYIFFSDKQPGLTAAFPIIKNNRVLGVFGVDIALGAVSDFLHQQRVGSAGQIFIINEKENIVAASQTLSTKGAKEMHLQQAFHRPILKLALSQEQNRQNAIFPMWFQKQKFIVALTAFPKNFGKKWRIVLFAAENDFVGPLKESYVDTVLISLGILVLAIGLSFFFNRSIVRPILKLTRESIRIKNLRLGGTLSIKTNTRELLDMAKTMNAMKNSLRAFKKYVPENVVKKLVQSDKQVTLGGEKKEISIMFSDVKGFTSISEKMPPEKLTQCLSKYLDVVTNIIMDHQGIVDKYIGDGVMALWGASRPLKSHVVHMCKAALECRKKIDAFNKGYMKQHSVQFLTRIGLHTGVCVVGNMGSDRRLNFTAIGDNVNLTSRLEGINKTYGTDIIVSEAIVKKAGKDFVFCPLDIVAVRGKERKIKIYELVELVQEVSENTLAYVDVFSKGFAAYFSGDKKTAQGIFAGLVKAYPGKLAPKVLLAKCKRG